jgi:putative membrane protein
MFHNFFFNGMWFGWIFWVGIIALIIWLLVNQGNRNREYYQHQNQSPPPAHPQQQESPLDIIKMRYAKGEITKEQFEQMKKDLG